MFWGDHNPSANGAVTPYYGSDSPSDGSSRRAGLAGVGFFNRPQHTPHQLAESALTAPLTLQLLAECLTPRPSQDAKPALALPQLSRTSYPQSGRAPTVLDLQEVTTRQLD